MGYGYASIMLLFLSAVAMAFELYLFGIYAILAAIYVQQCERCD